ncbi:hypothetical protein [Quisquiliibacterium transsilvanicum]|jgi:hypothetical protein|uniref:Uncharacterized protein n=1 Tax=Quisquiliibacterium transsilvanicum TaxID=1549638 RepID=A0A7W8HKC1_9BURK|nr:hypothetical protein [Quisquiliibacterium transsilvanicum]MBB5273647.1 hypothetical protein [Quisquiliibacterium transsilvanicum]
MPAPSIARSRLSLAAAAALVTLAACGDGEVRLAVSINFPATPPTGQPLIVLSGTASLPDGSVRLGGTPTVPWVSCQPGPYTMGWRNETTGSTGTPIALWNCNQAFLSWSTGSIALAPGVNRITVTIADATGSSADSVSVTR